MKSSIKLVTTCLEVGENRYFNFLQFSCFWRKRGPECDGSCLIVSKAFWGAEFGNGGFNDASSLINRVFLSVRFLPIFLDR